MLLLTRLRLLRQYLLLGALVAAVGIAFVSAATDKCAQHDIVCPGDVTNIDIQPANAFEFTTERARIRLEVLDADVVRVRLLTEKGQAFQNVRSAAVVRSRWSLPRVQHSSVASDPFVITTDRLRIEVERQPFRLVYRNLDGRVIAEEARGGGLRWIPNRDPRSPDDGFDAGKKQLHLRLRDGEDFYGLGEKVRAPGDTSLSWRHRIRDFPRDSFGNDMDHVVDVATATNSSNANLDVPVVYSTRGFALFLDNTYKKYWDFTGRVDNNWFTEALGGELRYYFLYGPDLKRLLATYALLTGRAALPPRFAFGLGQSGYEVPELDFKMDSWEKVSRMVARYRRERIPLDTILLDLYWFGGLGRRGPDECANQPQPGDEGASQMGALEFDTQETYCCDFRDATRMLKALRNQGIKVVLIQEPFVATGVRNGNYRELTRIEPGNASRPLTPRIDDKAVLLRHPCFWGEGSMFDSTNPAAMDFWWSKTRPLLAQGAAGIWLDLGEPEFDLPMRPVMQQARAHGLVGWPQGESWYAVNNIWNLKAIEGLHQRWVADAELGRTRPFFLTRSGFAGQQRFGAAVWSGDVQSKDVWLAPNNAAGLNLGLSGIPYWNTDIGGFKQRVSSDPRRLLIRWTQNGAFHPVMRFHGLYNNSPFAFDDQTRERIAETIRLRYRLLPYIYSAAREAYETGLPLMRPLVLEFPDDNTVRDDGSQYLFGPSILVAPITSERDDARDIYLPRGQWIEWYSNEVFHGPMTLHRFSAPLDRIPLFVNAGAVIPMTDPLDHTDHFASAPLVLRLYPPAITPHTSNIKVYDDDGRSLGYQAREFTTTPITMTSTNGGCEVRIGPAAGSYKGQALQRTIRLEVIVPPGKKVTRVNAGGRAVPQSARERIERGIRGWTMEGRVVYIQLPGAAVRSQQVVRLTYSN